MTDTVARLRAIDFTIKDEWVAHFILAGLPDEYDPMIMALQKTGQILSLDDIKLQLLQEKKKPTPTCHEIENNALLAENIALRAEKEKMDMIVCFSCGDKGHYPDQCNKRSNNKERGFKRSNIKCWNCDQTGHYADKFKNNRRNDRNSGCDDSNDGRGGRAAWIAALKSSDALDGMRSSDWIVDSGASVHNTNREHAGIQLRDNIPDIVVASGNPIKVAGEGDNNLNVKVRGDSVNITTKKVLYLPDLCSNLLSVAAVTRTGKQVLFTKERCFIKDGRKVKYVSV